jgi:molybdate transport system substrate-binding protein
MSIVRTVAACAALIGVALVSATPAAAPSTLTVFAASDLAFAFRELIPHFERAAGVKVTLVLGSTGHLAKQVEHGAPADVFFAADQTFIDELVAKGAVVGETRALYAQGRIVLATAHALRAAGVWDAVRAKLVYGENIRQALQFVESGAAEAGIVALSIARVPGVEWVAIDPALHKRLDQAVAVVRRSPQPTLAVAFIQFVNAPAGRAVMKRHGFLLPDEL